MILEKSKATIRRSKLTKIRTIRVLQKCMVAQALYTIHTLIRCRMPERGPQIRNFTRQM